MKNKVLKPKLNDSAIVPKTETLQEDPKEISNLKKEYFKKEKEPTAFDLQKDKIIMPNINTSKLPLSLKKTNVVAVPHVPSHTPINNNDLLGQLVNASEKNETVEVLKELFDLTKLKLITDLKPDHVSLITRMLIISDIKDVPQWVDGINTFMQLRISTNRKSRTELIKCISGIMQQKRGLMDRVLGREP